MVAGYVFVGGYLSCSVEIMNVTEQMYPAKRCPLGHLVD